MNEIQSTGGHSRALAEVLARRNGQLPVSVEPPTRASAASGADQLELSQTAQLLARLDSLPDVRQDVIDRVSALVNDESYPSDAQINAAIENLAEDLT